MKSPDAGWSSQVAREAHNLEVVGSNPAPATEMTSRLGRHFLCAAALSAGAKDSNVRKLSLEESAAGFNKKFSAKMVRQKLGMAPLEGGFTSRRNWRRGS